METGAQLSAMFLLALTIWIQALDTQAVGPKAPQMGVSRTIDAFSLGLCPLPFPPSCLRPHSHRETVAILKP